jgi:lysophospholipase L1-like esterase
MKSLILFGDSMLANFGINLIEQIEAKVKDVGVYNCAVGGATTKHGLDKVQYISRLKPDIILLSFGINDIFKHELSVEDFLSNLKKIISFFNDSRIIIWLTPKANDINDIQGSIYFNEKINRYNEAIIQYCKENKKDYIDSFSEYNILVGKKDPYHEDDGIHLTDEGYNLFTDSIIKLIS